MTDDATMTQWICKMHESAAAERTRQQEQRARFIIAEAERAACDLCDAAGYRPNNIVCDHIDRTEIAARGIALCRDVLKLLSLKRASESVPAEEPT